jgi:uncharacterized repeat protein (TIGR02543 family)
VGNGSVAPPSGTFDSGTVVTLTATPDPGWRFDVWSGDLTGTTNPAGLTMDAAKAVTATFVETFGLTVSTVGNGGVAPLSGSFDAGSVVTLTATPDPGWRFDTWSGDLTGATNPATLTMDAAKTVTATFVQTFDLTTASAGNGSVAPPSSSYDAGSVVTLTASPDPGFLFTGWSGDLTGTATPTPITMDANKSVTASFARPVLTPTLVGQGSVGLSPPGGIYDVGTTVTLTATPNPGWRFDAWSGDLLGSTNPATLSMDADKTVTATFVETFDLTASTVGNGSVAPPSGTFDSGSVVTLTATPDPSWRFDVWSGDLTGSTSPDTLTMDAAKAVTATFVETFDLTVGAVGNGSIAPPSGAFDAGSVVTLTATPDPGWRFDAWSGDLSGSTNPATLSMDAAKTVTATFVETFELSVSSVGDGGVNPASGSFDAGSVITLTATPDSGWRFDAWSGDVTGVANPETLTMDADKTVTVTFIETFDLTASSAGNGGVTPTSGTFDAGAVVTLTATPDPGFRFDAWSGDLTGSTNPGLLTMNGPKSVTAGFVETECSDGIDNDADGLVDFPADPGCESGNDVDELSPFVACDDGLDNDLDGLVDSANDPGCRDATSAKEDPQCDDGIDNDGDATIDFAGGPLGEDPDPQCGTPYKDREKASSRCGLGFELALLMPALLVARSARRRSGRSHSDAERRRASSST